MEKVVNTVPTEMITEEMREAGVDETTPLVTREEVVAEIGEEAVVKMETEAANLTCSNCDGVSQCSVCTPVFSDTFGA